MPATAASAAHATRKRRCVKSGLVARLRRTLMLIPVHHPSDKSFEVPVGERFGIIGDNAFRKRRVKQRTNFTMEFVFKRADKLGKPRAKAGNANLLNSLLPGVLIVGSDGIDFLEQHLRGKQGAERREFGRAVATQNAVAHDCGSKRNAGDAGKKSR